jgi:ADP-sugar diphosphatase
MDPRLTVTEVTIQSCDFGPKGLLFIKFKATIFDSAYKSIPSVVFMRGGSVAMLLVFSIEGEDNKKYTIMTRQARTPVGIARFFEIPAGMIDASNNFGGVAATEIKEELGLTIPQADLFDLTDFVYQKTQRGVYPSAGGCDEFIRVFLYEKTISRADYDGMKTDMEARITGNEDEGERIKLKMVELDKLIFHAPDMKALSAVAMYAEFDRQRQVFLKAHGTDNQMVANGLNLEFQRRHRQGELVARDFGAE